MPGIDHPVFLRLRAAASTGPVVVAHRGDSVHHAENTLAAFAAARALGVLMQEFDVRATRDGVLCCVHDATFDRTTNAGGVLGPGVLVAQADWHEARRLDAGSAPGRHGPQPVPSLHEALATMLPDCIPLLEHKAGAPRDYVAALQSAGAVEQVIVQSFDWDFVAEAGVMAPGLARAVLGPTPTQARLDAAAIAAARRLGAGMVHWHAVELHSAEVAAAHAAGLLVCSYTTDDELGWRGGAVMGIDAMCTNDPGAMLAAARAGLLTRPRS